MNEMSRNEERLGEKLVILKKYVKGKAKSSDPAVEFLAQIILSLDNLNRRVGALERETNLDNMVDLYGEDHR